MHSLNFCCKLVKFKMSLNDFLMYINVAFNFYFKTLKRVHKAELIYTSQTNIRKPLIEHDKAHFIGHSRQNVTHRLTVSIQIWLIYHPDTK